MNTLPSVSSHPASPEGTTPHPVAEVPAHGRLGGLDGLRAIAVGFVLVYHLFPPLLPGGFLGVDVFFVISGFLITTLLLREWQSRGAIGFPRFWQRRARRLLPALALTICVTVGIGAVIGGDVLLGIGAQILGASFFVSNWVFIASGTDYFAQDTPELLRNTWSLAIEEQFYVLLPLLLVVLLRLRRTTFAVALLAGIGIASAALMAFLSATGASPTRVYFGSDTHIFGLFLGAAAAYFFHSVQATPGAVQRSRLVRTLSNLAAALVTVGGLTVLVWLALTLQEGSPTSFRGGFQLATVAALLVVVSITRSGNPIARVLDVAPLRFIGERSYGIYLWHWPFLVLALAVTAQWPRELWLTWLVGVFVLALTVAAAMLSYRYVELPIRSLGLRGALRLLWASLTPRPSFSSVRGRVAVILVALVALAVPATIIGVLDAPSRSSAESAIERGRDALTEQSGESPHADTAPPAAPDTPRMPDSPRKPGPPPPADIAHGPDISAVGDSVMLASAPELSTRFPGIMLDADVSRGLHAGVRIVEQLSTDGSLRHILVIGLGTNGPVSDDDLNWLKTIAGNRQIVLVNAFGDRWWIPEVNTQLSAFADAHRGVVVADWNAGIAPHPEMLAGDQIHPHPSGGEIYASLVADAVAALATPEEAIGFGGPRR